MSLNQCFWLNVSKNGSPESSAMKISFQAAAIKMMSPVGKKLTPMIAISVQGILFEMGYNCFGSLVGSILMSFWSFLQPLLIYSVLLGPALLPMIAFYSEKTGLDLYAVLFILVLFKVMSAVLVSLLAKFLSKPIIEQYGSWILKLESHLIPKRQTNILKSPLIYSAALIAIYLYFTSESFELFIRHLLFYVCWMVAVNYLWGLIQKVVLSQKRQLLRPQEGSFDE